MFGPFGAQEIFLVLVIALILFGPRRLPDIGKSMGKMMAEFRKASNEFKRTLEDEVESEKARETAPAPAAASASAGTTPSPYSDGMVDAVAPDSSTEPLPAHTEETAVSPADQPVSSPEVPDAHVAAGPEPAPVTTEGEPGTISRPDSRPIEPR
jgi:sec-independent protein translocase protein TatB